MELNEGDIFVLNNERGFCLYRLSLDSGKMLLTEYFIVLHFHLAKQHRAIKLSYCTSKAMKGKQQHNEFQFLCLYHCICETNDTLEMSLNLFPAIKKSSKANLLLRSAYMSEKPCSVADPLMRQALR